MTGNRAERHTMETQAWSAWLDGELDLAERAAIEAHLAACPACWQALVEWRALREQLPAYAPPSHGLDAARAFWRRLEPRLRPRRAGPKADLAPCLTPLALAMGHAVWQGILLVIGLLALLGGRRGLAAAWQQIAPPGTWWGAAVSEAGRWLAQAGPAGRSGVLWPVTLLLLSWWVLVAMAGLYAAWLLLWLRPSPAGPALSGR